MKRAIVFALALAACKPKPVDSTPDVVVQEAAARDIGDPCRDPGAVVCAPDSRSALVCKDDRLAVKTTCKGPGGCTIDGGKLACDDTIAEVDDACDLEGQAACSTDGTSELHCIRGKLARVRVCHKSCKATSSEIMCD